MKKKILFICFLIMLVLAIAFICYNKNENKEVVIYPESSFELPSKENGFTCTGLVKDNTSWWIGNYGKEFADSADITPSIVNVSEDFSVIISEILGEEGNDIQGIALDKATDTLWYSNGSEIVNINKDGDKLFSFYVKNNVSEKPNGLAYSEKDDTLWVLCFHNLLINYTKQGEIIEQISFDYPAQDHICFDDKGRYLFFDYGADYEGEENFVCQYDLETQSVVKQYKAMNSYAVEGIYVEDGLLYIANDGVYHETLDKKNVVNVYRLK